MKVTVEPDRCIASGQCALLAGEVFDQRDDDGVVVLLNENPPPDQAGPVHEAAKFCPALAIHIEE
ncbi:ferredoxin [Nocardia sp. NPDC006630]|uniref:ferredoxin n=1 Tax=Nocardia sp. NPDC006630 TaxID=3157181 RepID=UPI0033A2AC22